MHFEYLYALVESCKGLWKIMYNSQSQLSPSILGEGHQMLFGTICWKHSFMFFWVPAYKKVESTLVDCLLLVDFLCNLELQ